MTITIETSRAEALDRTLMLMRDHVGDSATDLRLIAELSRCRVLIVADHRNSSTRQGQVALVTTALLCARMGMKVVVSCEDIGLVGCHPPLVGSRLLESLGELGADLIPGSGIAVANRASIAEADLCVLIGDTSKLTAGEESLAVRASGDDWSGELLPASEAGEPWTVADAPFGAMSAAALAAGEAFKIVMRRLRDASRIPIGVFDATFASSPRAAVRLAPIEMPCPSALGHVDFISGGAITHAALYALSRINDVTAVARVIEPQTYDLSNLNRYLLMRRSNVGLAKAKHLRELDLAGIQIEPIVERYDEALQRRIGTLSYNVLVGVDHIPSRWLAQANSHDWLCVAGTEHYQTVGSFHNASTPCAACLHHSDAGVDPRAPTIAFVSFWAGLWLSVLFLRHLAGEQVPLSEQEILTTMLRPDLPYAISRMPVPRRSDCRLSCGHYPAKS